MRKIEFEVLIEKDNYVVFKVDEQTHKGADFTPKGNSYRHLQSITMPGSHGFSCHLQGDCAVHDKKPMVCTKKEYAEYVKDKDSYNKKFKEEK